MLWLRDAERLLKAYLADGPKVVGLFSPVDSRKRAPFHSVSSMPGGLPAKFIWDVAQRHGCRRVVKFSYKWHVYIRELCDSFLCVYARYRYLGCAAEHADGPQIAVGFLACGQQGNGLFTA